MTNLLTAKSKLSRTKKEAEASFDYYVVESMKAAGVWKDGVQDSRQKSIKTAYKKYASFTIRVTKPLRKELEMLRKDGTWDTVSYKSSLREDYFQTLVRIYELSENLPHLKELEEWLKKATYWEGDFVVDPVRTNGYNSGSVFKFDGVYYHGSLESIKEYLFGPRKILRHLEHKKE